ncbi:uncharacterized protein pogzb [Engraulis encrasicolus]|uniref:uncharacterized protein pogzb n=1 Tax=Engraulis encrasicolus TaxID=184585 RepID=UPI002FD5028C
MADSDLFMECEEEELEPWQQVQQTTESLLIEPLKSVSTVQQVAPVQSLSRPVVPAPAQPAPIQVPVASTRLVVQGQTQPVKSATKTSALSLLSNTTPLLSSVGTGSVRTLPAAPGQQFILAPGAGGQLQLSQLLLPAPGQGLGTNPNQPIFITTQGLPVQNLAAGQNPVSYVLNVQQGQTMKPITLVSAPAGFKPGTQIINQPAQLNAQVVKPPAAVAAAPTYNTTTTRVQIPATLTIRSTAPASQPTTVSRSAPTSKHTFLPTTVTRAAPLLSTSLKTTTAQLSSTGNTGSVYAVKPLGGSTSTQNVVNVGGQTLILVSGQQANGVPASSPPASLSTIQETSSGSVKLCPRCGAQFKMIEALRGHMCFCCPDLTQLPSTSQVPPGLQSATMAPLAPKPAGGGDAGDSGGGGDSGGAKKLVMYVDEFYYGAYEGNRTNAAQDNLKEPITFKCTTCGKKLRNNIRLMNHMKHHVDLEHQNGDMDTHTSCRHCYRQFPTPFRLQCHLESVHSSYESNTKCKICEWSFDTEPVFLQHMKNTHKPGEMPYVCQVCDYRSSFYSDVYNHFRTWHEDTRYLLCLYCLKVFKNSPTYQHHFSRHQKSSVYHCNKCRLQFLFTKEKLDHKMTHHKSFRKPRKLEGVLAGTKVTIRAHAQNKTPNATAGSAQGQVVSSKPPPPPSSSSSSTSTAPVGGPKSSKVITSPWPVPHPGIKIKPISKMIDLLTKFQEQRRYLGKLKCIECHHEVADFSHHFPTYVHCSLCSYSTCCSRAYAEHMISNHVSRKKNAKRVIQTISQPPPSTLKMVCADCCFITRNGDVMAKHLVLNPDHAYSTCTPPKGVCPTTTTPLTTVPTTTTPIITITPTTTLITIQHTTHQQTDFVASDTVVYVDEVPSPIAEYYLESDIKFSVVEEEEEEELRSEGEGPSEVGKEPDWALLEEVEGPQTSASIPEFTEAGGPSRSLRAGGDAIEYFQALFPDSLMKLITDDTNNFAQFCGFVGKGDPDWTPVTVAELKSFVGLCLYMGSLSLPETSLYWKFDYNKRVSLFVRTMTCKRFRQIGAHVRVGQWLSGEQTRDGKDMLELLQPMVDILNVSMWEAYSPNKNLSIGRALLPHLETEAGKELRPRHNQPRVWLLCDSRTGYCHRFHVQTRCRRGSEVAGVVPALVEGITGRNHHVYLSKSLASMPVLQQLLNQQIYASATVLPESPVVPKALSDRDQVKTPGDFRQYTCGPMMLTRWKDVKEMFCLSTNCLSGRPDDVWRRSQVRAGQLDPMKRPQSFQLLQENMRGVDICNQLLTCYKVGGVALDTHWRCVLWFFINLCVINSFIVFRERRRHNPPTWTKGGHFSQAEYRKRLAYQLIKLTCKDYEHYTVKPKSTSSSLFMKLVKTPRDYTEGVRHYMGTITLKPLRCKNCTRWGSRHESRSGCVVCMVNLCKNSNCFWEYHGMSAQGKGPTTVGFIESGRSGPSSGMESQGASGVVMETLKDARVLEGDPDQDMAPLEDSDQEMPPLEESDQDIGPLEDDSEQVALLEGLEQVTAFLEGSERGTAPLEGAEQAMDRLGDQEATYLEESEQAAAVEDAEQTVDPLGDQETALLEGSEQAMDPLGDQEITLEGSEQVTAPLKGSEQVTAPLEGSDEDQVGLEMQQQQAEESEGPEATNRDSAGQDVREETLTQQQQLTPTHASPEAEPAAPAK